MPELQRPVGIEGSQSCAPKTPGLERAASRKPLRKDEVLAGIRPVSRLAGGVCLCSGLLVPSHRDGYLKHRRVGWDGDWDQHFPA